MPKKIKNSVKRNYYHRICSYEILDPYRLQKLYDIERGPIFHAFKKLLVAGQRDGGKDKRKDVTDAIWSLERWLEMTDEEAAINAESNEVEEHKPELLEEDYQNETQGKFTNNIRPLSNRSDMELIEELRERNYTIVETSFKLSEFSNKQLILELQHRGLIAFTRFD